MSHVMNTYARQPVAFVRGEGVWLWDEDGRKYLDALAGIAVNTLGYAHPKLTRALSARIASGVIHTSNLWRIPTQEAAADRVAEITGLDEIFFCNSGLEATEASIKVARKYGHDRGVAEPAIIVMEKAFHGRSLATLSATGSRKVQAGFEPLVSGFVRVPFDDLEAVRRVAESNRSVIASMVELIQGEGGINVCHADYLHGLRRICDERGWLLILDEVQSGMGRTGTWFAFQHSGVAPDIMTLAKGLGNGIPIGACLASGTAAKLFKPGSHGSTFGGNPFACAAAIETLAIIEEQGLMQNAVAMGETLRDSFRTRLAGKPGVLDIRGQGLMIGIELAQQCGELVQRALEAGLLINVTADTVIRLLPPLNFTREQGEMLVDTLVPLVEDFLARHNAPQAVAQSA